MAVAGVPVQFFQSVIGVELAVAGALLWQMRFFEYRDDEAGARPPHPRVRLVLAVVLGGTLFGSLWAIANDGGSSAAAVVTVGLAVSLLPILLRVLPPLAKDAKSRTRDPNYSVTIFGLALYVIAVGGVIGLLAD